MRTFFFLVIVSGLMLLASVFWLRSAYLHPIVLYADPLARGVWHFQSIDTMKFSRDVAREKSSDQGFDSVIDEQVQAIADAGATHIALATPYDEEFIPFLTRWVKSARAHGLHIWFRGNFSGWEGWFDYPRLTREEHLRKTQELIRDHPELFVDGDAFSGCPECENGGVGDPRLTGDVRGYRAFLIAEYKIMQKAFQGIGKRVTTNYFSMNGDVARLVMDRETTRALGGVVTIDHYVADPKQLANDVHQIALQSGGQVLLGEFGAPIPDIHGRMTDREQAKWIADTLQALSKEPELVGVNYWLSVGGSTALWSNQGVARLGVSVVDKYFHAKVFFGRVYDDLDRSVPDARVQIRDSVTLTNEDGYFQMAVPEYEAGDALTVSKKDYREQTLSLREGNIREVRMEKMNKTLLETLTVYGRQFLIGFLSKETK